MLGGLIQDAWGASDVAGSVVLSLQQPENPVTPTAVINGPSVIGPCRTLELSAAASYGNGGKDLQYKWKYLSTSYSNHAAVQALLENKTSPSVVEIDSDELLIGKHVFEVEVSNWIGRSTSTNITMSKVGVLLPTISVPFKKVSVRRSESLSIATKVKPATCGGEGSELLTGTEYVNKGEWTQMFSSSHFVSEMANKYAKAGLISSHKVRMLNK